MEIGNTTEQPGTENSHKNKVHKVLAYSYLSFFLLFLFSLFLDFLFPLKVFENYAFSLAGVFFLALGTFLIFWAQRTSLDLDKENLSKETFCQGPYRYTRGPTHLGLFFLVFGFGIITNALFVVVFSIISLILGKFVFLRKEEKILAEKYGAPYLEYKKSIKF